MIEQLWLDEEEFEPIETTVMVEVCLEPSDDCPGGDIPPFWSRNVGDCL